MEAIKIINIIPTTVKVAATTVKIKVKLAIIIVHQILTTAGPHLDISYLNPHGMLMQEIPHKEHSKYS